MLKTSSRRLEDQQMFAGLCFEDQESFAEYYFEGDIKYYLCIQIYAIETFVIVILKEIYIIFIYEYWHYNLC